ncbi:MAG: ATP synthase F0 subunit C [Actinobacteria bacterium]|nr:ATP synthase F0 subunit C [Actinomycetota bacterium]
MNLLGAVKFPPIENVIEWPAWLFEDSTYFAFNKIAFIHFLGLVIPMAVFLLGARGSGLVPRGFRTVSEGIVTFVDEQIAKPGIGHGREPYLPLLVSFFLFIFIGNITEVIPFFQMPANARMAGPLVLALVAWGMFISVGVRHNGPGYFKEVLFPPGVPKALYLLVTPIEFLSTFLVRPFSHAVRLFANMLAGHILLITFGVLCPGIGIGYLVGQAVQAMARQPESAGQVQTTMFLGIAFTEALALIGFVVFILLKFV